MSIPVSFIPSSHVPLRPHVTGWLQSCIATLSPFTGWLVSPYLTRFIMLHWDIAQTIGVITAHCTIWSDGPHLLSRLQDNARQVIPVHKRYICSLLMCNNCHGQLLVYFVLALLNDVLTTMCNCHSFLLPLCLYCIDYTLYVYLNSSVDAWTLIWLLNAVVWFCFNLEIGMNSAFDFAAFLAWLPRQKQFHLVEYH